MRDIYVIAPVVGKQLDFSYLDKASAVGHLVKAKGGNRAGFLGEIGTFSQKACSQYFGDQVTAVPMSSFRAIFDAIKQGETQFGIVPLENSLAGSIHENYDLLMEYDFKIIGEITLRIMHHLVGHPGTQVADIRRVFSHPQVFEQCRQFLDRHPDWELISAKDTATAVRQIKEAGEKSDGAIASREAAEAHGMKVIEEGIETNPRNYTRFVVIGMESLENGPRKKSSLVYSAGNRPGSLYETLKIFAEKGINLVKLESRPIHGKPWEYMFYVDLEADATDASFQPILKSLEEYTDYLRILGTY
jgi:prephenate dehydratase